MSYILDALRRAEAQRQQQNPTPPGLGSAPLAAPPAHPSATPSPSHPAAAQAATTSRPERSTSARLPAAKLGAAALVVIAIVAALLISLRQPLRPTPVMATAPGEDRVTLAAPPDPVPAEPATILSTPNAPMLQPAAPPKAPPVQPASAPPRPPADAVPRYADLPEGVRAGLPAISVQGVTWSENPALRHLIVNGRVLQEGQPIGPDHVLEQIGREGSVLSYRGQRYRIGH